MQEEEEEAINDEKMMSQLPLLFYGFRPLETNAAAIFFVS